MDLEKMNEFYKALVKKINGLDISKSDQLEMLALLYVLTKDIKPNNDN